MIYTFFVVVMAQLVELQQKLSESNRAYQQTASLKRLNEDEKEKGKRTISELERLSPDAPSYRAVRLVLKSANGRSVEECSSGNLYQTSSTLSTPC
jgi:hypothetical protein